ncbi:MAG: hypothetical protein J5902_01260 [Paludibacteraceae bacterium]|nr:hypothetical protein [Paludibacteraceae bacterium]
MKRCRYIVFLLLAGMVGQGCSSRAIHEAEAVVAEADSLWREGKIYGVDAGDSLTLAQAYETLGDIPLPFRTLLGIGSSDSYAHACYHYGKLLRAKDHPAEAMQAFICATHSRTHDYHILGRVYSNMGDLCHLAGDFQLSYDMFEKSANCFLEDKDTLSYYFLLNDMAYELAEQGKKESFSLINRVDSICKNQDLQAKLLETKAVFYRETEQYDSTIFYADKSCELGNLDNAILLLKAQAYDNLGKKDSAIRYAQIIMDCPSASFQNRFNALYIVKHCDSTLCVEEIEELYSQREDIRYYEYEPLREKWILSTQLLIQDLTRKPDWQWLYTMIATVLIIGAAIVVYVYRKHKKHDLLAQKISGLTLISNAVQANHEKLVNRYESQHQRREEETLHRCALLRNCPQIAVELKWNDFDSVSNIIDSHFYLLATKLRQKAVLNETEIRLCILVLIGLNRSQIANTMPYALNSIGKLKDQTAKKLGTSGKNLRDFLIKIVVDE